MNAFSVTSLRNFAGQLSGYASESSINPPQPKKQQETTQDSFELQFSIGGFVLRGPDLSHPSYVPPFDSNETEIFISGLPYQDLESLAKNISSLTKLASYGLSFLPGEDYWQIMATIIGGFVIHELGHLVSSSEIGGKGTGHFLPAGLGYSFVTHGSRTSYVGLFSVYDVRRATGGLESTQLAGQLASFRLASRGWNTSDAAQVLASSLDPLVQLASFPLSNSDYNNYQKYMVDAYPGHDTQLTAGLSAAGVIAQALNPLALYNYYLIYKKLSTGDSPELPHLAIGPFDLFPAPILSAQSSALGTHFDLGSLIRVDQPSEAGSAYVYARGGVGPLGYFGGLGFRIERLHFGASPFYANLDADVFYQPKIPNRFVLSSGDNLIGAGYGANIVPGAAAAKIGLGYRFGQAAVELNIKGKMTGIVPGLPIDEMLGGTVNILFDL